MSKYDYYKMHDYSKIGDSYDDMPTYQDFNYKRRIIAPYLVDEDMEEEKSGLLQKIENLQTKIALSKIKKIIINEMKKDYYKDITNLSDVVDIDTHLMKNFLCGIDYMHVENLVIWHNSFYNFNCFNFPIPASVKLKIWNLSNGDIILPKNFVYYQKNELICK